MKVKTSERGVICRLSGQCSSAERGKGRDRAPMNSLSESRWAYIRSMTLWRRVSTKSNVPPLLHKGGRLETRDAAASQSMCRAVICKMLESRQRLMQYGYNISRTGKLTRACCTCGRDICFPSRGLPAGQYGLSGRRKILKVVTNSLGWQERSGPDRVPDSRCCL
jgi:hypothetical protein